MNTTTADSPLFVSTGPSGRTRAAGQALGYLVATGSSMLGAGIAAISWIVAAICYDGSPLFGCSDGTKTPDIAAGHTFVAIGFCALAIGLGLSWAIVGGLRRSSRV